MNKSGIAIELMAKGSLTVWFKCFFYILISTMRVWELERALLGLLNTRSDREPLPPGRGAHLDVVMSP